MAKLEYLKQYGSVQTVNAYKSGLKDFFQAIYNERNGLEGLAERYLNDKRNYEEDIQTFLIAIKDYAPKTVKLRLTAVRMFLLENGIEMSQQFWRRIRGRVRGTRGSNA